MLLSVLWELLLRHQNLFHSNISSPFLKVTGLNSLKEILPREAVSAPQPNGAGS